jgi:very-short-patch-repair endonuclease
MAATFEQLVDGMVRASGLLQLSIPHLSQLLQAHLASQLLGLGLITLPPSVLEVAVQAYREDTRDVTVSKSQREVGESLRRLGVAHELEHITADGLFSIDLAVVKRRIAIEFDGPSHFTRNTHEPLGRTRLCNRLLSQLGWHVVSIPHFEWDRLHQHQPEQDAYVKHRMSYVQAAAASALSEPAPLASARTVDPVDQVRPRHDSRSPMDSSSSGDGFGPSARQRERNLRIEAAQDAESIYAIAEAEHSDFDAVKTAAAWHRLATTRQGTGNEPRIDARCEQTLLSAAVRVAPSMDAQNVADTLWALAKLGWQAEDSRMRVQMRSALEEAAARLAPSMNAEQVASTLWAHGKLGWKNRDAVLRSAAAREAPSMDAQDVASTLKALAKLGWQAEHGGDMALRSALEEAAGAGRTEHERTERVEHSA